MKKKQKNNKASKVASTWDAKTKLIIGLAFFAFGFLLYSNTLNHDYTLDDFSVIKENYVTQQGIKGIPTAWKEHYRYGYWNSTASLYRPLTLTTFNLDWAIAPDSPAFSHFVNVLLYGLTGMILFMALVKVLRSYNPWIPILITALFIAHPLHVECVANIKGRDEILGFMFLFSTVYSFWRYMDHKKMTWLLGAILSFSCALFSKESSITFVAILPLMVYVFRKENLSSYAGVLALFLLPVLIFLGLRYSVVGVMGVGDPDVLDNALMAAPNKASYVASAISILGLYLVKLFFPVQLVHEMGYSEFVPQGFSDWKFLLSFLIYLALGIYSLLQISKKNLAAFGILFFLLSISILSNVFIVIGVHYAERLLYYPLLGFCMAFVYGLFRLFKVPIQSEGKLSIQFAKSKIPVLIAGLFVLGFSVQTIWRNPVWKNSFSLYQADISKSPKSAKLNYHYGLELVKRGIDNKTQQDKKYLAEAKQQFEKSLSLYPKYADAHAQLGLAYYRTKQKDLAMASYEKSLQFNKNNAKVYSNMGIIYFEAQQLKKAEEVYRKSIKIDPRFVDARRNLGSVLAMQGQFPEAIEHFKQAILYEPNDATLHFYLGQATRDGGDPKGSEQHFNRAYTLNPALKK